MNQVPDRIRRQVGRALRDFSMLQAGDVVAVGVSGGKDSYTLLDALLAIRRRSPVPFEVRALLVDQGFVGFDASVVVRHLEGRGVPFRVEETDTLAEEDLYGVEGGAFCSFCAKQRRGILYRGARELGCNKLALGHHRDDVIETLLMNMFFNGRLRGMPARLAATGEGTGMELIRPLVYVPEEWIAEHAREADYPTIPCGCPTCGTSLQKRRRIKLLLSDLEAEIPGVKQSLLVSMQNVEAQQMLLGDGARNELGKLLLSGLEV